MKWNSPRFRNLLPPYFAPGIGASGAPAEPTLDYGAAGLSTDQVKESTNGAGVLVDLLTLIKDATIDWSGAGVASGAAKIIVKESLANALKIVDAGGGEYYAVVSSGSARNEFRKPVDIDLGGNGRPVRVGGVRDVNLVASGVILGTQENPTGFDNGFQFAQNELNSLDSICFFETAIVHTVQAGGGFAVGMTLGGSAFMAAGANITPAANDRTIIRGWFVTQTAGVPGKFIGEATVIHVPADGAAPTATRHLTTGTAGAIITGGTYDLTASLTLSCFIDRTAGADDTNSSFSPYFIVRTYRFA
jgi:hypothetical protein